MPGLAKTNTFMLGTATVMIGAMSDLYALNPDDHSIGLVKNFSITSEPAYTELTQGVKNTTVASVMTANPVRCSMEAYEFTSKNIAYGLGIAGADTMVGQTSETTLSAAVTASATTCTVVSATGLVVGSYIMIIAGDEDNFITRKITNVAGTTLTIDKPLPAIATGKKVLKVNMISIGSKDDQPYYAAKVTGKYADGTPCVLLLPKIRIVRGFNLGFKSDNFGNLPIELTIYDQTAADTFYADFGGASAQLLQK